MTAHFVQQHSAHWGKTITDRYAFVVCQRGTEATLKQRFLNQSRPFRLAFSRPGLLTFKRDVLANTVEPAEQLNESTTLDVLNACPLVRLAGWGDSNLRGENAKELWDQLQSIASGRDFQAIHLFERDRALPGLNGFEPGSSEAIRNIEQLASEAQSSLPVNQVCPVGSRVLDVVLVEPTQWLVGHHVVQRMHECWPGGVFPVRAPEGMISRAYLKIAEALAWSELPIQPEDHLVEIGSSPGGSCQRLLDLGLQVTGIDAAAMHPLLVAHPRFEHWRTKAAGVKRRRYAKFKWLAADANVAPNYTLEMVEDIVQYPTSRIAGLMLTLKLSSYDMLDESNAWIDRVRKWGFSQIKLRQLAFNRREVCLSAQR